MSLSSHSTMGNLLLWFSHNCTVNSGGGVLLSIQSGCWGDLSLISRLQHGFRRGSCLWGNNFCIEWSNTGNIIKVGGQERAQYIDIRKHFAQRSGSEWTPTPGSGTLKQLTDNFTKGLHAQPWAACVKSILREKWENPFGTSILTRGVLVELSFK